MKLHAKISCLGREAAGFGEATKREWQGDTLTGKQNSSTTVGKSWSGLLHLLLLRLIRSSKLRSPTALSRYCWWWQLGLLSLTPADDGHPDCLFSLMQMTANQTAFSRYCWGWSGHWTASRFPDCHWWILFTCQNATLSHSFCYFMECSNVSSRTRGFCMLALGTRGSGEWIPLENVSLWVWIPPWKFHPISSMFAP